MNASDPARVARVPVVGIVSDVVAVANRVVEYSGSVKFMSAPVPFVPATILVAPLTVLFFNFIVVPSRYSDPTARIIVT